MIGRDFYDENKSSVSISKDTPMIECRNISVGRYKEKFDFKAYAGEIVGIFGLIGSGRTEFAKVIFGIDTIRDGEIFKQGKRINNKKPWNAINNKIGLIPEDRKLYGLNLKQNIRENTTIIKLRELNWLLLSKNNESKITDHYINRLAISARGQNQIVNRLSGGNQQKVVIAKWLSIDTDILIMDEPTRGIDVGAKSEIYTLMQKLASEGKCIIIISSDLPEILRISNRVIVMHDGRITFDKDNISLTQEIIMNAALN